MLSRRLGQHLFDLLFGLFNTAKVFIGWLAATPIPDSQALDAFGFVAIQPTVDGVWVALFERSLQGDPTACGSLSSTGKLART